MVRAYRETVSAERELAGGWRNESFRPSVPFGEWLKVWHRNQAQLSEG
jgi:hypothetical protein